VEKLLADQKICKHIFWFVHQLFAVRFAHSPRGFAAQPESGDWRQNAGFFVSFFDSKKETYLF